jgi:hypothetical protein
MDVIKKICHHESSIYPDVGADIMKQILNGEIKLMDNTHNTVFANGQSTLNFAALPNKHVSQKIILLGINGGGIGYPMFKELKPTLAVKEYCHAKYSRLKQPYLCVQIRNTDLTSDYIGLYEKNKQLIHSYAEIYIATDDKRALEHFRSKSPNVVNFTQFGEGNGPLHLNNTIDPHRRMMDLICDIYIIAMAETILSNSDGCFIHFVKTCNHNKHEVIKQFRI